MFRLMRNVHLIFGLIFFFYAIIFAVSSLTIIYRPWLGLSPTDTEQTLSIPADQAATPRALALELMRDHGLKGDLRQAGEKDGEFNLVIARPGTTDNVRYSPATGQATIKTRRQGVLETMVQLHTNHGFWHDYLPANAWAMLSFLGSAGLFLLGATGVYLWFCHNEERVVGSVILALGLIYGITSLVLSRIA